MANLTSGPGQDNRRRTILARIRRQPRPIEIKLKIKSDTQVDLHPNSPSSTSTQPLAGTASPRNQTAAGLPQTPTQTNTLPATAAAPVQDGTSPESAPLPAGVPATSPYDDPGNTPSSPAGQKPGQDGQSPATNNPQSDGANQAAADSRSGGGAASGAGQGAPGGRQAPASQAAALSQPDFYNSGDKSGNPAAGDPAESDLADREKSAVNDANPASPAAEQTASLADRESVYDQPGNLPQPAPAAKKNPETAGAGSEDKPPAGQSEEPAGSDSPKSGRAGDRANFDDDVLGDGYKPSKRRRGSQASNLLKNRYLMGTLGVGVIAALITFGGFLSAFKLNGLMENVSARTFARLQGVEDRRSQAWMRAYLQIRLMDIGDHPDLTPGKEGNLLFRANRVNNGYKINTLALDWYRTLRASSFEQDVFNKHGIKFVSYIDENGRPRPGVIHIDGTGDINLGEIPQSDIDGILKNDPAALTKYGDSLKKFDNDKQARQFMRKVIADNTEDWQVFKRRQIRKSIQNMTGVRNWRFFETTRDKVDKKKLDIRNKIISKAIPADTWGGKFIHCLFGISDCKDLNGDSANPEAQAEVSPTETTTAPADQIDSQANGKKIKVTADPSAASDAFKKITSDILQKVTPVVDAVNVISTLDSISRVNDAIVSGKLSKTVAVARGVQAMGIYQVFQTAADQTKSGQVNSTELNALMGVMATASASEGWSSIVQGNGNGQPLAGSLTTTVTSVSAKSTAAEKASFYCDPKNQARLDKDPGLAQTDPSEFGFAYECPDKQVGSVTNAGKFTDAYKKSIGKVISPILDAYNQVRHNIIIGFLADLGTSFLNGIFNIISSTIIQPILKATGLAGEINKLMGYITGKLMAFMGAGPIINGQEPAGVLMNWVIQGGAFSAESTARMLGGSATTPASMAQSQIALADFTQSQNATQSLGDRLFALSNPNSLAAKTSVALANFHLSNLGSKLFNFSWFGNIFGFAFHPAGAAAINGYAADNFAGIQTYDYPGQCYNDPLTMTPQTSTNIQSVMAGIGKTVPDSDLTWDLMTDSTKWYAYIYSLTSDDKLTEQIYNCALLDASVRGSLGYLYGYNNDGGLDSAAGNVVSSDSGAPATAGGYQNPLRDIPNLKAGRIDEGVDYSGSGPIHPIGNGKIDYYSYPDGGWLGGIFVSYTLTDGAAAGKSVYVAENCIPSHPWKVGDTVTPTTVLCDLQNAFPNLETGWAPGGAGIASAHGAYHEGDATAYGRNFSDLLQKLGAPAGTYDNPSQKGNEVGALPAGWPSW